LSEEAFIERVMEFDAKKRQKIQQRLDEKKDDDLKDCTFRPDRALTKDNQNESKRNLD